MIGPLCSSNAGMANEDFGVRCLGTALVPKRRQAGALQNEPKTLPHNYHKFMTESLGFSMLTRVLRERKDP